MTYYTLLTREAGSNVSPWAIEFGDYDKECVEYERDDYRDKGYRASDLKIIRTKSARQSEIVAAVAKLNGAAQ